MDLEHDLHGLNANGSVGVAQEPFSPDHIRVQVLTDKGRDWGEGPTFGAQQFERSPLWRAGVTCTSR